MIWIEYHHTIIDTVTSHYTVLIAKIVSIVRKYHNHKPQTTPRHPEEEPLNRNETPQRQIKQSNQLSLFPIKTIAILEWTLSNVQQNIEQLQTPTMGVTINKKSTTTEPLP